MDLLQSAVAAEVQKLALKDGVKNPEMELMITDQMVGWGIRDPVQGLGF
jgi:hypothetical protein